MTTPDHDATEAALTSVLNYTAAQMVRKELFRHGLVIVPAGESERLTDKIEGLEADLDSALDVLWRRGDDGAREWVRMNYKSKVEALMHSAEWHAARVPAGKSAAGAAQDMREAADWLSMETAPAPAGCIDMWPQFYLVNETTVLRYAHDEGEAICLIRARFNHEASQWEPFGWLPLSAPQPAYPNGPCDCRLSVPAESAGAARDMREAAHEYVSANLGHSSSYCKHCGGTPLENAATGQSNYCLSAPTPAPQPDQREAAIRSADEIRAELARCNSEAVRAFNYNANNRNELTLANDARIAALEWVLSPSKPKELPHD